MSATVLVVAVLLVVYQLKHFVADYLLQGEYMLGKFKPGWEFLGPLLAHVAVHAGFTYMIAITTFGVLGAPFTWWFPVLIALLDGFVHFFMDRIKASPRYMGRWKPLTAADYVAAKKTVDQLQDHWHRLEPSAIVDARKRLSGNKLFWWALGFDQMVHHLTHYACIYFILRTAGAL